MYDDLVKSLRICSRCDFGQDCNGCTQKSDDAFCCDKLLHQAADAIEELQTYADLYKDMTEKSQRVARKVIDSYPKWIPVTERLPECEWGAEVENIEWISCGMVHAGCFGRGGKYRDAYFRTWTDAGEGMDAKDADYWRAVTLPEPPEEMEP